MNRLLPWCGENGKPAYLHGGEEGSYLSRLADNLEATQLGMAEDLLSHVAMMAAWQPSEVELAAMIRSLTMALRDVLRVARSRGGRLAVSEDDAPSRAAVFAVRHDVRA